ncbi:hypothetical protein N5853_10640 [Bartonella sp. HY329]|uniref:hypothetical protein n=1 Tax=unclassified Bartonella TaxID=2645622 RepID=UPI0021C71269|nr:MULTISPECIES: hypothetical protein [unclassified Bartonella]UXM94554.1 hypothetical protein N5853_10640 [Bartonella sp. HY329]UXN08878.1 hypothetical protein N5852_10650 [Bartonella sp. HY328]
MAMDAEAQSKLQERVEEADNLLALHNRARKTKQWAAANFELGSALAALAASEDDRLAFSNYKKAIETFEPSLKFYAENAEFKSEYQEAVLVLARTIGAYAQREGGDNSRLMLERAKKLLLQLIDERSLDTDQFDKAQILVELGKLYRISADLALGDNKHEFLKLAIAVFKQAAQIFQAKEKFENWADAVLGEAIAWREISTLNIEDPLKALLHSVEMLKTVLNYYTPASHPLEWFFGHFEFGRAFFRIALLNENEQRHNAASAAVDAMRIALQTASSEIAPQLILRLRIELALALSTYAQTLDGQQAISSTLEAILLYKELISQFQQSDDIYGLAVMQSNLGKEHMNLAQIFYKIGNEEECQNHYQLAADILRQSNTPTLAQYHNSQWLSNQIELAKILYNFGNHLGGKRQSDTHLEAVEIYRNVLKSLDNDRSPTTWRLKIELSLALSHYIHSFEPDNALIILEETTALYKQAIDEQREICESFGAFVIEATLGKDLLALATCNGGKSGQNYRFQAIDVLRQCISPALEANNHEQWLSVLVDLGMAFYAAANNDDTVKRFALYEEAIEIFRQILQKIDSDDAPEFKAKLQNCIALSLANIGENDQSEVGLQRLKEAELSFRLALQSAEKRESEIELMRLESNIANLFYTLARRSEGEEAKSYIHYAAQTIKKAISRIRKDILPNEWLTSQSNYGLILKHMVENNYSDDLNADYARSVAAFEEALTASTITDSEVEYIVHLQNLVATLLSWSQHCEGNERLIALERAFALLAEVEEWAENHDQAEIFEEAQQSRAQLALVIKDSKPKKFLKRLFPFIG